MSCASVRPSARRSGTRSMPSTGWTRSKIISRAASMPKRLPPKAKKWSESGALRVPGSAAGRFGDGPHRLDLGGAELELRDLAERIERRIGQDVGRRLGIAERDEHHAVGHVGIDA